MSMVRCYKCGSLIDSDYDPACFVGNDVLCDMHRCQTCGEHESACDDECIHCHAAWLLENPVECDPDCTTMHKGQRVWLYSLPGWSEAHALYLAKRPPVTGYVRGDTQVKI